jgi:hypothetical protein
MEKGNNPLILGKDLSYIIGKTPLSPSPQKSPTGFPLEPSSLLII